MTVRKVVSHTIFIHLVSLLGLAALFGAIATNITYLYLCVALSFGGALCGSFIKVIDSKK